jgi:segregation and condensation protein A
MSDLGQKAKFEVRTEVFEGPLDLLLNLIEKRKLLINDVSLAQITDDYLSYVKENKMTIGQNSNFVLVASTLLLIKSKSLLPMIELTQEEEQSIEDLELRLKIHKRLKQVEPTIAENFMKNPAFYRRSVVSKNVVFAPSKQITVANIKEVAGSIIKTLPKVENMAKAIVQEVISLEEMITKLTDRVQKGINTTFREFSQFGKEKKVNVIVGFLAMLELVKEGIIETSQGADFDDIHIQTKEFNTPNYS